MNARIGTIDNSLTQLKKRYPTLRRHQLEALALAKRQAEGNAPSQTLIEATPGAGKSALPSLFLHTLRERFPELKMMWIVPRKSLQAQGVDSTNDTGPFSMKTVLGTDLNICEGGNVSGVGKGCDGYTVTYQSINRGVQYHLEALDEAPYAIFLDECHHIKENVNLDSRGEDAGAEIIAKLLEHPNCKFAYFMTGTAERHDQHRLAFIPYCSDGEEIDTTHPEWNFIRYTRADAIAEGAKLPLTFEVLDASGECAIEGCTHTFATLRGEHPSLPANKRLRTAIESDFAYELIDRGMQILEAQRRGNPNAQMIVIAGRQHSAKNYLDFISDNYAAHPLLATSNEASAQNNIIRFRQGRSPILVTVGMAHEGLDAPSVGVLVVLTRVRSKPWLEQAFDRATRIDHRAPETFVQEAVVIVPADDDMTEIREMIVNEQRVVPADPVADSAEPGESFRMPDENFNAIESEVTDGYIESETGSERISIDELRWLEEQGECKGIAEALVVKRVLNKQGIFFTPVAKERRVGVTDAKRMLRGTGNVLKAALLEDARLAAVRNGANRLDENAPWDYIAKAIEEDPASDKKTLDPNDISRLRAIISKY